MEGPILNGSKMTCLVVTIIILIFSIKVFWGGLVDLVICFISIFTFQIFMQTQTHFSKKGSN